MLTADSCSDYDHTKKAEYYDEDGFMVADEANKDRLAKPALVKKLKEEQK